MSLDFDFDSGLLDILENCGYLSLRRHFVGTTKAELKDLLNNRPIKYLRLRLYEILPQGTERENLKEIAERIIKELEKDDEDEEPLMTIKKEIKEEKVEVQEEESQPFNLEEEEIKVLDIIPGDVSIQAEIRTRDKPTCCVEIQEIEIEDNAGEEMESDLHSAPPDTVRMPEPITTRISNSSPSGGGSKHPGIHSNSTEQRTNVGRYIRLNIVEGSKRDEDEQQQGSEHDEGEVNNPTQLSERKRGRGRKRKHDGDSDPDPELWVANWTWEDWRTDSDSTSETETTVTTAKSLDCSEIHELCILTECDQPRTNDLRQVDLSNLRTLEIKHDGLLNYDAELVNIIQGTGGRLEEIEFVYDADYSLSKFLTILRDIEPPSLLQNLKWIHIENGDPIFQPVAICNSTLEILASINAPSLQGLYLGLSMWEDSKPGLEKIFERFSNLRQFTIKGCFVTRSQIQPSVVINFPPCLPNLDWLDFGGYYKYSSTYENAVDRPAKKVPKFRILTETDDNESRSGRGSTRTEDEDLHGEVFMVSLNLPVLPSLKTLVLGCLYEIQDLHFSKMPSLQAFRVSSPWHVSVKFPKPDRNKVYQSVVELQFPDSLKDPSFVQSVASYFPNVMYWYFNIPSVNVVRAFAHVIKNEKRPLKVLDIKIQFDFPSSLDWIMLDEPWAIITPTQDEKSKIRTLKEYRHWEEYVQINQIELPPAYDDHVAPPPEERFNGLESISKKYKNLQLQLKYLPRTLRLPRGDHHFNDDLCEFTNTLIGYEDCKYPFGKQSWRKTPKKIQTLGFDLSNVPHKKAMIFRNVPSFTVDQAVMSPVSAKPEQTNGT